MVASTNDRYFILTITMKAIIRLYHIYTNPFLKLSRALMFGVLYVIVMYSFVNGSFPRFPLFFLSVFATIEVFFYSKFRHVKPPKTVAEAGEFSFDCVTVQAGEALIVHKTISSMIESLIGKPPIQFLFKKIGLADTQIPLDEVNRELFDEVLMHVVKGSGGSYITTVDIVAAYLLGLESKEKLLFTHRIAIEQLLHIVTWTKSEFPTESRFTPFHPVFWGEGIAEDWVHGWTPETKPFVTDITSQVLSDGPSLAYREREYQQLVPIMESKGHSSVLLLGEPGVGKRALVEYLAFESCTGKVTGNLYHQRFYELNTTALVSNIGSSNDLASRLEAIMTELAHSGNVVLYVPEIQNILGASTFQIDVSAGILPYIEKGSVRMIATSTQQSYQDYIVDKSSFVQFFEVVHLEEPTIDETIQILFKRIKDIERENGIAFTYRSIIAAAEYADRYLADHVLPGSAIALLEEVASRSVVEKHRIVDEPDIISMIESKTHISLELPVGDEKNTLLHLEEKLHANVIGQDMAVNAIAQGVRRNRAGIDSGNRPISFLFLGPTGVGKTEMAKALARIYFGGEEKIFRLDMSEYSTTLSLKRLLGATPEEGNTPGELTKYVHDHPSCLILLDEFEKAHPDVLNLFLQILDDGRLTDNQGTLVSFANTMIIATSNAGSEFIREAVGKGISDPRGFQQQLLEYLQTKGLFKPELLNRFDDITAFQPLQSAHLQKVADLLLQKEVIKLAKQDITISYTLAVTQKIVAEGQDIAYGARPLRRYIQHHVEDMLASKMLNGEISRGSKVTLLLDPSGEISSSVTK